MLPRNYINKYINSCCQCYKLWSYKQDILYILYRYNKHKSILIITIYLFIFLHTVYDSYLFKLINNNSIITFSLMQDISVRVSLTFTGLGETLSLPAG